jgi:hypothetical protein
MANCGELHVPRARAKLKTHLPNGASIARRNFHLISWNVRFVRPEPTFQSLRLCTAEGLANGQELSGSGSWF